MRRPGGASLRFLVTGGASAPPVPSAPRGPVPARRQPVRMSTPAILAIAALNLLALPAQAQALPDSLPLVAIDVNVLPLDADASADATASATPDENFGPTVAGDALDAVRGGTDN